MIAALSDVVIAAPTAFLIGVLLGLGLTSRYRIVRAGSQEPSQSTHHVEVQVSVQDPGEKPAEQDQPPEKPEHEPGTDPQPDHGQDAEHRPEKAEPKEGEGE